ncbi:MAG: hypothetical protein ACI9EF_001350 [Pseudohongiellaceae bacterium]|jgi:hypothetical protein
MDTTLKTLLLLATLSVALTAQDQESKREYSFEKPLVATQPVLVPFVAHRDAVLEF